jgi:uncharacterized membrane protein (DUF106 family)
MGKKSKELEKCKSEVPPLDVSKKHDKRVAKLQDDLKTANMELAVMRMRSALFLSVSMLILHALLARMFGGVVVAKLPFQPYSLFYGVTHRTLTGLDYTDCSFVSSSICCARITHVYSQTFIYILSSIAIRTNFIKAFGEQPPKGSTSNLFELPKDMDKES